MYVPDAQRRRLLPSPTSPFPELFRHCFKRCWWYVRGQYWSMSPSLSLPPSFHAAYCCYKQGCTYYNKDGVARFLLFESPSTPPPPLPPPWLSSSKKKKFEVKV